MKGYIYKIYDNTNGNVYYGSTKELVSKRIAKHKAKYNCYLNKNINTSYCKSYEIIKNNDYSYCVVEEVEYESKWELLNRERYYIENNKCINKFIPNRTSKEYGQDNKEIIAEKNKIYRENNKEIIAEKKKIYRENNKEILFEKRKIYCENNKEIIAEKSKTYYQNNKEQLQENIKKYKEENKEKLKEERNKKITCECGCVVSKCCLTRHKKSKKHLLFLETLQ